MTEPSKQSGSDPVGDLQRWLVRSGARSVTRQLSGQIRTALGGGKQSTANVWETATTESDDSPECAWCPHCRARRLVRESGPGLGSGVAAAADAVGVVMRDAMSAFEAAVVAASQQTKPRDTSAQPQDTTAQSRDTSAQPQDTTAQSRDTTAQPRDTTAQPPGEVWGEATDEPAVRTRPPANGHGGRQSGAPPQSAGPKPASTGTSQPSNSSQSSGSEPPSAGAKPPSAGAKPPSAGGPKPPSAGGPKPPSAGAKQASGAAKQATGAAKRLPAGPKKPAADAKKPAGRSGGTAATDRTPPDNPTPAKPDEPAG